MTTMTIRSLFVALGVGLVVSLVAAVFFGKAVLLSTLVGYVSAAAVTLSSFRAYASAVQSGVENGAVTYDLDRDTLDKIDDPYDLDDAKDDEEPTDPKTAYKEAKAALKANRRSFTQTLSDSKPAFSPWRLGAYALLVLGFFYLHRHAWLHLPAYLIALSFPMLISVGVLVSKKKG